MLKVQRYALNQRTTPTPHPPHPHTSLRGLSIGFHSGEGGHWVTSLSDWLAAPIDRRAAAAQARKRNMAEAGKEHAGLGLPVGEAAQWPLQRYGRFMPSGTGEPPGPGQEAGMASSPTWKVRPGGGKGWEALTRRREGRTTAAWFLRHCVSSIGRWILNH